MPRPSAEEVTGPIGSVPPAPSRGGLARYGTPVKVLALVLIAVLSGIVWWLANRGGSHEEATANSGAAPAAGPSTNPAAPGIAVGKYHFQRVGGPVDNSGCGPHSYGKVRGFFGEHDCAHLHQVLYETQTSHGKVLSSVSTVTMPNVKLASALKHLTDADATGNVTDLVTAGVRLPGGPDSIKGGGYASQRHGRKMIVVESGFFDGGHHDQDVLTKVSKAAVQTG